MHSAFEQFAAFHQDAIDNRAFAAKGKLNMSVLAIGRRFVASDVTAVLIPDSGHWLLEEQPAATVAPVRAFLEK
jgi:pimeloyl-ACP methyl ester carboxylesterase